jgi:hypothetical protein
MTKAPALRSPRDVLRDHIAILHSLKADATLIAIAERVLAETEEGA